MPCRFYTQDCGISGALLSSQGLIAARLTADYQAVDDIMKGIIPDHEVLDALRLALAGCLDGHNRKHFLCLADVNGGNNGKSTVLTFLQRSLGSYCKQLPKNYFMQKVGQGSKQMGESASPFLSSCQGARLVLEDEATGAQMAFDTALLKNLTNGQDASVVARQLYSGAKSFSWSAKLCFAFNNQAPAMDLGDQAGIARMRAFPFLVRFVQPGVQYTGPLKHAPADPNLKQRIPELRLAFILWLLRAYPTFAAELQGVAPESPAMLDFKYQILAKTSDAWRFLNEHLVTRNSSAIQDRVNVSAVYDAYLVTGKSPISMETFIRVLRSFVVEPGHTPPAWVTESNPLIHSNGQLALKGYALKTGGVQGSGQRSLSSFYMSS